VKRQVGAYVNVENTKYPARPEQDKVATWETWNDMISPHGMLNRISRTDGVLEEQGVLTSVFWIDPLTANEPSG
jgi:hypothetical protein